MTADVRELPRRVATAALKQHPDVARLREQIVALVTRVADLRGQLRQAQTDLDMARGRQRQADHDLAELRARLADRWWGLGLALLTGAVVAWLTPTVVRAVLWLALGR